MHFVVVSHHQWQQTRPLLPATSVINSLWFVGVKCIAFAAGTLHSTQWGQMLARNRDFYLPHRHSTPPLGGGVPLKYCHAVWYGKTRMAWLPDSEKNSKICLFVLTECTNLTDRRTDRHCMTRLRPHLMLASRGKNTYKTQFSRKQLS